MPADRSRRWLLRTPSEQAGIRLFCLPYSGCGASMYRQWPRFVGELEICPVQLPGRESRLREEPCATYEELAGQLADGLLPYLDRPFAFFGHCGSALPGYATAVRLAERGYPVPARIFVSSQVAPHQGPYGRFLEMSDEELRTELAELIRQLGGRPTPDLLDVSMTVLRADIEMNKRYHLAEPLRLDCPISAIGWRQDDEVAPDLMAGWADCAPTDFRLLDGEHYRFMSAPPELLDMFVVDLRARSGLHFS
ncbi:thioesterase II family protein [Nonomuraea guangzhouensis]|uniref:Thioesterase II family protein n=1 Tax=Nonomuraea guangzhouensis TaxID=1291555 RepID=A0ABW4GXZ2_9ACTN|nr:thioesterase domain-containing protein [Nonomuraea guangzhouensis]